MNQMEPPIRTYYVVAGLVGGLLSLFAFFLLTLPRWKLLIQLAQFSLATQLLLLLEVASPLLTLLLSAAWIAAIRWLLALPAAVLREQPGAERAPGEADRRQVPEEGSVPLPSAVSYRAIAVPPLFQHDPTEELPLSPFPRFSAQEEIPQEEPPRPAPERLVLSADPAAEETGEEGRPALFPLQPEEHPEAKEQDLSPPSSSQARLPVPMPPVAILAPLPPPAPLTPSRPVSFAPLLPDAAPSQRAPLVMISLLGSVRVWLNAPGGLRKEVPLRRGEQGIRQITLAYVAYRQGEPVDRDKLLTHVFARGHRREASIEQLGEAFDGVKRFLRDDLRKAVHELNALAGEELISPKSVSFFLSEQGFYRLAPCCQVRDLETVERCSAQIHLAREAGLLDGKSDALPHWVLAACQTLLETYTDDFLAELIGYFPEEFDAWVREPYTRYRDRYLEALWILASYEQDQEAAEPSGAHQSRAAHYFRTYAMHAISGRKDSKLKFAHRTRDGKDGERVIMSERAIRRCIVEWGKIGRTDLIDQDYLAYKEKMLSLSEGQWKPDPETEEDAANARAQTSAYRFSAQVPLQEEHFSHP